MLTQLKEALSCYTCARGGADGPYPTEVEGLTFMRAAGQTLPNPLIYRPALCVVAQGAKQLTVGDTVLDYRAGQALVVSVEVPAVGRVIQASPQEPFLGLSLEFDPGLMREVLDQMGPPARPVAGESGPGVFVDDLAAPVADAVLRLVRLLDTPAAIPVLYPAIMREICFWLLTGPNGDKVSRFVLLSSQGQRITDVIHQLRDGFDRPMRVEELAAAAGMSPSSFHQHFKALTAMTPLQYQKQLRLLEARRLMAAESVNAANAAYRVGYESASQFSREYARMFGAPPKRDATERKAQFA